MLTLIQLILMVAVATTEPTSAPATQPVFPSTWTGRWTGPATFVSTTGKQMAFEMEVAITPTDDPNRLTWEIVYIDQGKRQVRPYELLIVDAAKGRYVIDEKSSIKLDSYFIDGALYSQFLVQNSIVTGSYRVNDDVMFVELITSDATNPHESGGQNNVPVVTSNPIKGVQRAELRRTK